MERLLIEGFWMHLKQENPELFNDLQTDYPALLVIQQQIEGEMQAIGTMQRAGIPDPAVLADNLRVLIEELSPARFMLVKQIFQSICREDLPAFMETGLLNSVILHIVIACKPVFRYYGFEKGDFKDKNLRYAIGLMVKFFLDDFDRFLQR